MEQLDLSPNQLACPPLDFSATLGSLLCLDLSQLLATLDPCSLWGLGNPKQLNLSHNQLAELGTVGLGVSFTYTGSCYLGTSCSKLVQPWPQSQAWRSSDWEHYQAGA